MYTQTLQRWKTQPNTALLLQVCSGYSNAKRSLLVLLLFDLRPRRKECSITRQGIQKETGMRLHKCSLCPQTVHGIIKEVCKNSQLVSVSCRAGQDTTISSEDKGKSCFHRPSDACGNTGRGFICSLPSLTTITAHYHSDVSAIMSKFAL